MVQVEVAPALDLQQDLVVVVAFPLTAVAVAAVVDLEHALPAVAVLFEQALPSAALDLQQDLVVVAVLTEVAVAVLDFVQVFVVLAAAALAAACGQP